MRIFGYILLIFNLAAAGAFVYFGTKDYRARRQIDAAGLRHLLLLQGLPVDPKDAGEFNAEGEAPFKVDMAGQHQTETVSKKLLEAYFKAHTAPAPAEARASFATQDVVTSQIAEVKRVFKIVEDELAARDAEVQKAAAAVKDAEPNRAKMKASEWRALVKARDAAVAARAAVLEKWLLTQAVSLDERMYVQARLAPTGADDKPKSVEQLDKDAKELGDVLRAKFQSVLSAPDPARPTPVVPVPDAAAVNKELTELAKARAALVKERADLADTRAVLVAARDKMIADKEAEEKIKEQNDKIADQELKLEDKDGKIAEKNADLAKKYADTAAKRAEIAGKSDEQLKELARQRAVVTRDAAERRVRIAHLLVHLDPDVAWQKRVVAVVGLRHYVQAVVAQGRKFREMASAVERALPNDQADYVTLESDLRDNAIRNYARARAVADLKKRTADQLLADQTAIKRRITDIRAFKAQLQKVKDEVDRLLVQQSGIEQQLFEIQREVGLTYDEIYRLEELLEATERERYGLPPPSAKP